MYNKKNNNLREKVIRLEERLIASDKALQIASDSMQARLATMNEFREQLKDQASKFITREELNLIRDKMEADIQMLREYKAMVEGKASQMAVNIALLLSIIGIIINIINFFVSK